MLWRHWLDCKVSVRIPRIYLPAKLSSGVILPLTPMAMHHVVRVLRLAIGAEVRVFDGEGHEFSAHLTSINRTEALVQLDAVVPNASESRLSIHLGQAISRGEKMDYTIQKAVELGVTKITPLMTERCGVKLSDERSQKRLQHWLGVIIGACEQSGRSTLPLLAEPIALSDWLAQNAHDNAAKLVLDPSGKQSIKTLFTGASNVDVGKITLLIGPEGGLTAEEISVAERQGFAGIRLGPRILRTETAALTAISVLQCLYGDLE